MEKDWEPSDPPTASISIKKAPHEEGLFSYIAGGNRTPITRTGILCDILYTTATVLDYLTTEGGFWQGLSPEFLA